MALMLRLGARQLFANQLIKNDKVGLLAALRPITIQTRQPPPPPIGNHDERNMKLGRPMSPHLTIYSPQLTSMLSISHRFAGMAMGGMAIIIALGSVVLPGSFEHYIDVVASWKLGGAPLFIGRFILAFPFSYHYCNGIRHLIWDAGKCLTLKQVYATGYIMLASAIAMAAALAAL